MNVNKRCDCHVELDQPTGVLRAITKCQHHQDALRKEMQSEEEHYRRLGALGDTAHYIREFEECFGKLPQCPDEPTNVGALEIGAGTSPYIPMIRAAGYAYAAVEKSPFAVAWLRSQANDIAVIEQDWEESRLGHSFSLILAAHCIEHMKHAPEAVKQMADSLTPGGRLYIIVPDDEDLCNPDHWWFFTEETLQRTVEASGLVVEHLTVKRRVKHEKFIYLQAIKPDK